MKSNFLLPMLAMIFAIGMSATEKVEIDASQDYYLTSSGTFMPIGREINCVPDKDNCYVRLTNGEIREVYDAPDPNSKKEGDGTIHDQ